MKTNESFSRREFLKKSLIGMGGVIFLAKNKPVRLLENFAYLDDFSDSDYFARNTVYLPNTLPIRMKPTSDATIIRNMEVDECLVWNREVVGATPTGRTGNNRWVETPEGFVYLPSVQKVRNISNQPRLTNTTPVTGSRGYVG